MLNKLVKVILNDDGDIPMFPDDWHLVDVANFQGDAVLCTGEYFGDGEGEVVYETKEVIRGGITCKKCLESLKLYKAVKL